MTSAPWSTLACVGQHRVVDEVEVETGVEDRRHDVGADPLGQRVDEAPDLARHEARPRVVVRQVERDVVRRPALAQQEAHPLQVARDVGHHDPPRVLVVEDAGRVEAPAGVGHAVGRVGPAVADELVDALEEVQVGLRLHVERRRPERRRVQPGPRLRRDDRPIVEVADRGRPPRRAQRLPLRPFALRQIDAGVARDGRRRNAVALDPELRAVARAPSSCMGARNRSFTSSVSVWPQSWRIAAVAGPGIEHERGQERAQVVAAARLEGLEEVVGPVGLVHLEAVAEHRVRGGRRRRPRAAGRRRSRR